MTSSPVDHKAATQEQFPPDSDEQRATGTHGEPRPEQDRELKRAPLDEDSLLWRYGADSRLQLMRGYTGILQNMHPSIGQALLDHSKFFEEPFARLERSTPQIIESMYTPTDELSKKIRDYHVNIRGKLRDGQRYHSLNPDTYWWAHATFVYRVIRTQDLFGTPFTREEREQIVQEGVTWWEKYGVSNRPVFDTYQELVDYIAEMTETVLERNDTVDFALRTARVEPIKAPDGVSERVWKIIWKPIMRSMIWLTIGTLEQSQRDILQVPWTKKDQKRFDRLASFIRKVYPKLPLSKRYMNPGRDEMIKHEMFDANDQLKPIGSFD